MHNDSEHAMLNFRQHVCRLICQRVIIDLTLIATARAAIKALTVSYASNFLNLSGKRFKTGGYFNVIKTAARTSSVSVNSGFTIDGYWLAPFAEAIRFASVWIGLWLVVRFLSIIVFVILISRLRTIVFLVVALISRLLRIRFAARFLLLGGLCLQPVGGVLLQLPELVLEALLFVLILLELGLLSLFFCLDFLFLRHKLFDGGTNALLVLLRALHDLRSINSLVAQSLVKLLQIADLAID